VGFWDELSHWIINPRNPVVVDAGIAEGLNGSILSEISADILRSHYIKCTIYVISFLENNRQMAAIYWITPHARRSHNRPMVVNNSRILLRQLI
jgi:hypothetical protein